jgi:sulfur-carrier protein
MAIQISIPSNLRQYTAQQSTITVNGSDVNEAIQSLIGQFPELRDKLLTDNQQPLSFVNIFVGGRSIRDLDGLGTRLSDDDTILIVPALAGG